MDVLTKVFSLQVYIDQVVQVIEEKKHGARRRNAL